MFPCIIEIAATKIPKADKIIATILAQGLAFHKPLPTKKPRTPKPIRIIPPTLFDKILSYVNLDGCFELSINEL